MRLIDAHCHFDFPVFDGRRADVLAEAQRAGISHLVIPGVRKADWSRVERVAAEFRNVYFCLGIHPWYVTEHEQSDLDLLRSRLQKRPEGCIAVGECGLDRLHGDLHEQMPWFEAQLDIAVDAGLPLVIHSVKTHDEVHQTLKQKSLPVNAYIHGFSGSYEQARKLVDLGCFIGVGGVITHERASKTREAVSRLPADALILETDAPDMAPAGVEKGQNSPLNVRQVLDSLAGMLRQDREVLAGTLLRNAQRLFGWDEQGPSAR